MFSSCLAKQEQIIEDFKKYSSSQQVYQRIIEWGEKLSTFESDWKIQENLVPGCQSVMYLHASFQDGHIQFEACSDALISAGLAALLIAVYNGEAPETILKCPPTFLEKIGVSTTLTPGRLNGLASLYLKMKQEAIKHLLPR